MPYYTKNMVRFMQKQGQVSRMTSTAASAVSSSNADDVVTSYISTGGTSNVSAYSAYSAAPPGAQPPQPQYRFPGYLGVRPPGPPPPLGPPPPAPIIGSNQSSNKPKRVLRITPSCVDADASAVTWTDDMSAPGGSPGAGAGADGGGGGGGGVVKVDKYKTMTFDEKRLMYMKNLLRLQVDRIQKMEGPTPTVGKPWIKYEIDFGSDLLGRNDSNRCRMYRATRVDFDDLQMVCKSYENLSTVVPNPFYIKILRHLGKKHPFILQTWDIFVSADQRIFILQEFANRTDLVRYMTKHGCAPESQVCEWAKQMHKALDYLGDMGICHRSIKPRHILLAHRELMIRLTGFYDSVIYWNVKKEDILFFPCIPVEKKNREVPDFQAPEVHGNPAKEEFDPISADIWSYAAVIYFMLSQAYPYDIQGDNANLEEEVQNNIKRLPSVSEEAKTFLSTLLCTNAINRITFDRITQQPWLKKSIPK